MRMLLHDTLLRTVLCEDVRLVLRTLLCEDVAARLGVQILEPIFSVFRSRYGAADAAV